MSALPEGKHCADCAHVENCVLVGNTSRQSRDCSFTPPMFLSVERGSSLAVRRQQEALAIAGSALEKMVAGGYVVINDGVVSLTPAGEKTAAELCAAHPEIEVRAKNAIASMRAVDALGTGQAVANNCRLNCGPLPEECTACKTCGGHTVIDDGGRLLCAGSCR